MPLPETTHLALKLDGSVLHATFDRPEARNALNAALVADISNTFDAIRDDRGIRSVVLRGAGGHFSAGADLKEVSQSQGQASEADRRQATMTYSRQFGTVLRQVNAAPQAVVAVVEGAALGGGFGLVCVSDVAIVHRDAKMGMPETRRGLPPAQIAPFVVERIGLTTARRIGVCGDMFDGEEAVRVGVGHYLGQDEGECDAHLVDVLARIARCAPGANAATKAIMQRVGEVDMERLLDDAAESFTDCLLGDEGAEGTRASIEKRPPAWEAQ